MRTKYVPILLAVIVLFVFGCDKLTNYGEKKMSIKKQAFGKTVDGKDVDLYTLTNANGLKTEIMTYGGIVRTLEVPDRDGNLGDIVLGYDSLDEYIENNPYFGALVGRYGSLALAASVYEPRSGRVMEIFTTEPAIQFYSGNFLDGSNKGKVEHHVGYPTVGAVYNKYNGFCLETQHFPDSPNKANFPSVVLKPGEKYTHLTVHKFSAK
jgi:galactose mutarotase-like enzyme